MNNATINMHVHVRVQSPAFSPFGQIARSGIAGSRGDSAFNCLRNYRILVQSSRAALHSHQQRMRIPIFPRPRNVCHFPFLGRAARVRTMWYLTVVLIFVVLNVFAS